MQEFLAQADYTVSEQVDARKNKIEVADAVALVRQASRLYVAKGKKVQEFDLKKAELSDEDIAALVTGPTGNVRAPIVRRGKKLFVGFNDELLQSKL